MKLRVLFLMLCSVVIFASCKKNQTASYNYTFVNTTGVTLNVVLYATQKDYYENTNPFLTYRVNANGTISIPSSQFQTYSTYYVDFYSDDYTISNWLFPVTQILQFDNTINPTPAINSSKLEGMIDYSRLVCINGGDTQTNWAAVGGYRYLADTYNDTTTPWAQLTADQQYIKMTMSKNHLLTFYYKAPYAASYGSTVINQGWQVRDDSVSDIGKNSGALYIRSPYDRDFSIYGKINFTIGKTASGIKIGDTLAVTISVPDPTYFKGTFYFVKDGTTGNYN